MGGPGSGPRRKPVSKQQGKRLLARADPEAARTIIAGMHSNDPRVASDNAWKVLTFNHGTPKQSIELETPAKIDLPSAAVSQRSRS